MKLRQPRRLQEAKKMTILLEDYYFKKTKMKEGMRSKLVKRSFSKSPWKSKEGDIHNKENEYYQERFMLQVSEKWGKYQLEYKI